MEASSISSLSSSNITSSSPKLGSPPNESILFPSRNTNNPNLPSSSSNNRINRVPTTIQFKTPEGMENKDKAVNFDENKILAGTRKHKHHYTPTIYFFFPNLIFDNKYTSISLYCINMLISFLLSLAYIPYIFIFFYIYGIYIMCSIIPPITQGWNPSESMPLMKGTCFFLFGACGFFIYQSIRYYRSMYLYIYLFFVQFKYLKFIKCNFLISSILFIYFYNTICILYIIFNGFFF